MNRKIRNTTITAAAGFVTGLIISGAVLRRTAVRTLRSLSDGLFEPLYRDIKTEKNRES